MTQRVRVWDLPLRIFHWLLVILIVAAVVTGKIGGNSIVWHGRIGLAIIGLLAFRIAWGFIGSTHARFASFFPIPSSVLAYLRGEWRGLGHNPLGALSVLGLLALIAIQVGTGLLSNDDIAFQGYLASLIGKETSDWLTGLHKLAINGLLALIALHLAAVAFHVHVKKDNLVKPMITGWKETDAKQHEPTTGGGVLALLVALLIAFAAVYGASGTWIDAPPAPPPDAASAW